jgi:hypothetical protein
MTKRSGCNMARRTRGPQAANHRLSPPAHNLYNLRAPFTGKRRTPPPLLTQQWMNPKPDGAENGDALGLLMRRQTFHPPLPLPLRSHFAQPKHVDTAFQRCKVTDRTEDHNKLSHRITNILSCAARQTHTCVDVQLLPKCFGHSCDHLQGVIQ